MFGSAFRQLQSAPRANGSTSPPHAVSRVASRRRTGPRSSKLGKRGLKNTLTTIGVRLLGFTRQRATIQYTGTTETNGAERTLAQTLEHTELYPIRIIITICYMAQIDHSLWLFLNAINDSDSRDICPLSFILRRKAFTRGR